MRYTLERFNQESLISKGLDEKDIFILAWFSDFLFSGKMASKIIDGKEYFWIKYQSVIDDLPILRIKNKEVLARRFSKYVKCNVLESKLVKNSSGTYTFFRISACYHHLLSPHSTQKSNPPDSKVETAPDSKVDPKDSTTNNSTTKDKYTPDFLNWFNSYPKEKDNTKASAFKWWEKRSKAEKENIIIATRFYLKEITEKKTKNAYIIAARNFIGRDERYLDYVELGKSLEKQNKVVEYRKKIERIFHREIAEDVYRGISKSNSIDFYVKKYEEENKL